GFERVISLDAARVVCAALNAAPRPLAELAERGRAQGGGASLETFDGGGGVAVGDLFDNLQDRGDDLRTAVAAGAGGEIGDDLRALLHEVIAGGVALQGDALGQISPAFERIDTGDG